MCRVYVARSDRDQRILVTVPLPPLPFPFSGPLPFHVLFLETKVKRKKRLSPTGWLLTGEGRCVGESMFVGVVRGCAYD